MAPYLLVKWTFVGHNRRTYLKYGKFFWIHTMNSTLLNDNNHNFMSLNLSSFFPFISLDTHSLHTCHCLSSEKGKQMRIQLPFTVLPLNCILCFEEKKKSFNSNTLITGGEKAMIKSCCIWNYVWGERAFWYIQILSIIIVYHEN